MMKTIFFIYFSSESCFRKFYLDEYKVKGDGVYG